MRTPCTFVVVGTVPAEDPAQVTALVIRRVQRRLGKHACADELVAEREVRPVRLAYVVCDVLPPPIGQVTVITAGDQLRAVLERDPVRGLGAHPPIEDLGPDVAAVAALAHGAVDAIAGLEIGDGSGPPVGHEDRRIAELAIAAGMTASAVRIDRPSERNYASIRHAVQGRFRPDFVEAGSECLGGVEGPDDRWIAVAGQVALLLFGGVVEKVVPAHERMFAYGADGR